MECERESPASKYPRQSAAVYSLCQASRPVITLSSFSSVVHRSKQLISALGFPSLVDIFVRTLATIVVAFPSSPLDFVAHCSLCLALFPALSLSLPRSPSLTFSRTLSILHCSLFALTA